MPVPGVCNKGDNANQTTSKRVSSFGTKKLVVDGNHITKIWGVEYNTLLTQDLDPVTHKKNGSHMDTK